MTKPKRTCAHPECEKTLWGRNKSGLCKHHEMKARHAENEKLPSSSMKERLHVRVSRNEKVQIERLAEKSGARSTSEYVVKQVLGERIPD